MRTVMMFLAVMLCGGIVRAQWDFDLAETVDQARPWGGKGMAVNELGSVYVLPIDEGDLFLRQRDWWGEWSEYERVSDLTLTAPIFEASIAWDSDSEEPVIAYAAGQRIYVAQRTGVNQWQNTEITDSTETALSPDIAYYEGAIYVVWIDETGDDYQLKYAYSFGDDWQRGEIVAELGAFGLGASPRVAVDYNLAGHVLFRGLVAGAYAAQHATNEYLFGEEWTVTTLQVPHAESYPGDIVYSDYDGHIHCVSQGSEGFNIPRQAYYHERDLDGNWTFGINISGEIFAGEPRVAVTFDTLAHGLWLGLSGNLYTGELGFWSESQWWENGIIYGNADGDIAFATDELGFGHLLVTDVADGAKYLKTEAPLAPPFWGPEISIEPDALAFGAVVVGDDSTLEVTLMNPNEEILTITGFDVVSPVFHLTEEWHTVTLMWGWSTAVEIRFAPLAHQFYSTCAVITSDAITSPDTVWITGRGVIPDDATDPPLLLVFELKPLYPNPFNGAVNVSYSLPRASEIALRVFDVLGREVGVIATGIEPAGHHTTQWNCGERAAGVYLFKLEAAGQTLVRKAAYVK